MRFHYQLLRLDSDPNRTLGALFRLDTFEGARQWLAWTLEDPFQSTKIAGHTRIPTGTYQLELRNEGSQHARYKARFPAMHRGMIHLRDVPNFKYVHLHIGNTTKDTRGCVLVGGSVSGDAIGSSSAAYEALYPDMANIITTQQRTFLFVVNYDESVVPAGVARHA